MTGEIKSYHDGVAGARGEVDVVWVGGDPAVSLLDVARHILAHALDALAGAVGSWEQKNTKTNFDSHIDQSMFK